MSSSTDHLTKLYDKNGKLIGVLMSADLWDAVKAQVEPLLAQGEASPPPAAKPEPLADWEQLVQFWDFKYPVDTSATCGICNISTDNWMNDQPRKFYLRTANLGGLVIFECAHCHGRITKRHFKDKITMETTPFIASKDPTKEARY